MSNNRGSPGLPPPAALALGAKLKQALALHQQGRVREAEALYRHVLGVAPNHPIALHFLGVVEAQRGRHAEAVALIGKAVAINPNDAAAHYNRARSLHQLNRFDEALAGYARALAAKPDHTGALINRGALLQERGRNEEALASFDRAFHIDPRNPDILSNRGHVLVELKRPGEALESCDRALTLSPDHASALNNRAIALRDLHRPEEALAALDRALALQPDNADALANRGNVLGDLKRGDEAIAAYGRALALRPRHFETLNNRAFLYLERHRNDAALASFDDALAIRPGSVDSLYGRGQALLELKRHDEAIADYEALMAANPDYPYAAGMLLHAMRTCCDWRNFDGLQADVRKRVESGMRAATPYAFLATSDSAADNLLCARTVIESKYPPAAQPLWRSARAAHAKIRLAYLSSDFRNHAVASLIAGVLERHDKASFETTGISLGVDDGSAMRGRLARAFDRFADFRDRSADHIARFMRDAEIDIAVDLTGFTGDGRPEILALRPAPVQINYLGYPGTMGAPYYDYILADACVVPDADKPHYAEKVVHLPDTYMPTDSTRRVNATPSRAQAGLPEDVFVFCSFNNTYKITPTMFAVWMRLLSAVPESVLWLSGANPAAIRNLRLQAERARVTPERLVFAPFVDAPEDHLARLALADLFLDTIPCNAHTTACDALWAGVPVLTCKGGSFAGRVAASLLMAANLPDMIAESLEAYEARALALARDGDALAAVRENLRRTRGTSALFDTERHCRALEQAYRTMWARHVSGESPESFAVTRS